MGYGFQDFLISTIFFNKINEKSNVIDQNLIYEIEAKLSKRYNQCWGAETFYREQEPEPLEKLYGAGARALKPYLMGAGAEAGKNPLKTASRSRESGLSKAKAGKRNL